MSTRNVDRKFGIVAAAGTAFILLATGALASGCGRKDSPPTTGYTLGSVPGQQIPTTPPANQTPGTNVGSETDRVLAQIIGTYSTTLTKALGASVNKAATVAISRTTQTGSNEIFLFIKFETADGRSEAYLNLVAKQGAYSGMDVIKQYVFVSKPVTMNTVSSLPFAFEIIIGLRNGATFDPTQSSIRIVDCGFSQSCGGQASMDAATSVTLIKR